MRINSIRFSNHSYWLVLYLTFPIAIYLEQYKVVHAYVRYLSLPPLDSVSISSHWFCSEELDLCVLHVSHNCADIQALQHYRKTNTRFPYLLHSEVSAPACTLEEGHSSSVYSSLLNIFTIFTNIFNHWLPFLVTKPIGPRRLASVVLPLWVPTTTLLFLNLSLIFVIICLSRKINQIKETLNFTFVSFPRLESMLK